MDDTQITQPGFKPGFWIFSLLTVVIGAFLFVPEGNSVPSGEGALLGLAIVGRALAILLMARWVAQGATAFEMARLGGRVGLRWLGFALGVAINALPDLEASARRTWDAMRMRGGFRRRRWYALRLFAVATLTNALMRADAQAEAATARGLGLEAPAMAVPHWTVGQAAFVVAAWAGALFITFFG
ncbi:hypothetical protein EON81_21755 [bacterium]|nr:MAG: hypothetical protein EON81_21755 [bacterium]